MKLLSSVHFLSVPSEDFHPTLLIQLHEAINASLHKEQVGFHSRHSCIEQIFTLCNIIKQCIEFQHPFSVNFTDFKKAFDSVHTVTMEYCQNVCHPTMVCQHLQMHLPQIKWLCKDILTPAQSTTSSLSLTSARLHIIITSLPTCD